MITKIKEKFRDMKSKKAFENFCKESSKQKLKDFNLVIQSALQNTNGRNQTAFIISCESFLKERGFLSEKQMEALLNISIQKKRRSVSHHSFYDDQMIDQFDSGADYEQYLMDIDDWGYFNVPNRD